MNTVQLDQAPITPSKVVCIGRNYAEHIAELGNEVPTEPVIFTKPNSAISAELRTDAVDEIHYEGEITFVVQSGALAAVGFGLDLTKRALQSRLKEKGLPWERAKAFDGSAVFSEFVSYAGAVEDLRLELHINDKLIQSGGCDMMMHSPQEVLAEATSFLTLEDGDLIMTGTPKGVGKVCVGDTFTGKIFAKDALLMEATWQAG